MRQQGFGPWLRRALLKALLAWIALTVLPVLALRWVPPLTSAFMLEAKWRALHAGERHYRTDYRWVAYRQISPEAGLAAGVDEEVARPEWDRRPNGLGIVDQGVALGQGGQEFGRLFQVVVFDEAGVCADQLIEDPPT
jgi:hypothetical protein